VIGEHRDERIGPTDEVRPKPSMHVAVDAEGPLQTLQQNVVINGVEGCR